MSDPRHALGIAAEDAAAAWLSARGWRVLARRIRAPPSGELDILALDPDRVIVAVEVRARRTRRTGGAAMSVDPRRVVRLRHALAAIAAERRIPSRGLRVDLVTVEPADVPGQWRMSRLPGIG